LEFEAKHKNRGKQPEICLPYTIVERFRHKPEFRVAAF
jgi:hypothetical protein